MITSLSIGDWVYNKHHKKAIQITAYDYFTHSHNGGVQSFEGVLVPKPITGRDLEPVDLTREILEANGLKLTNSGNHIFPFKTGQFYMECRELEGGVIVNIENTPITLHKVVNRLHVLCHFVHEWQRALRACGLSELANNIIVPRKDEL